MTTMQHPNELRDAVPPPGRIYDMEANLTHTGSLPRIVVAGAIVPLVASQGLAQTLPWDSFTDSVSGTTCAVINAREVEFVVSRSTGELVRVTGSDRALASTQVTAEGDVLIGGDLAGFIGFERDGDGLRTLWWTSLNGRVIELDPLSGAPSEGSESPADFVDVVCDACGLWDDPAVCAPTPEPPLTLRICGRNVTVGMMFSFAGLMISRLHRPRCLSSSKAP